MLVNEANGEDSTVIGGKDNTATEIYSVVMKDPLK